MQIYGIGMHFLLLIGRGKVTKDTDEDMLRGEAFDTWGEVLIIRYSKTYGN